MKSETATAAKTYFGKLLDDARKEPVMITKSGRAVAVIMAYEDYEALTAQSTPLAADAPKKPKRRSVAKRYRSILKYRIKRKEREEKGSGST
ncbi:MAG: type II toxin-antitoxin system prevent-host-death family antitoxin [Gammaproteobacteria bacterium CG11_big_fil_rev_8_21_14_0_20_46_22]|nr:MAG: type II toxin-antitoxin system prevent-host-death family antitoxin [Gammaproteobacteria bacterium CG12_big_fil_rev_8_21_14_0_65_46_12]PIR11706.1 MAG: type II toxin-antitoxin system prevent-host-death family antitoxin [Gammaproteobacteria bacterium CG11_big_fil_rev_8_21_14_0_20_46_22]